MAAPGTNKFLYPVHAAELLAAVMAKGVPVEQVAGELARMCDDRDRALEDYLQTVRDSAVTTFPITASDAFTSYAIRLQGFNSIYYEVQNLATGALAQTVQEAIFGQSVYLWSVNNGAGLTTTMVLGQGAAGTSQWSVQFPVVTSDTFRVTPDGVELRFIPQYRSYNDLGTLTGAVAMNTKDGNAFRIRLSGNITLSFAAGQFAPAGFNEEYEATIYLVQDGVGGRTLTTAWKWPGGVAPVLTAAANAIDIIKVRTFDGSTYYAELVGANYS